MGRDYSRRKQFLPSIRCQTSFDFTRAVRPTKSTGPSASVAQENEIRIGSTFWPLVIPVRGLDSEA